MGDDRYGRGGEPDPPVQAPRSARSQLDNAGMVKRRCPENRLDDLGRAVQGALRRRGSGSASQNGRDEVLGRGFGITPRDTDKSNFFQDAPVSYGHGFQTVIEKIRDAGFPSFKDRGLFFS